MYIYIHIITYIYMNIYRGKVNDTERIIVVNAINIKQLGKLSK
jgi:hypothetical protein